MINVEAPVVLLEGAPPFNSEVLKNKEVERKFILKRPPGGYRQFPSELFLQGYTSEGRRYRRIQVGDTFRYTTTVKLGNGIEREEEEREINEDEFNAGWSQVAGSLVKRRYYIPHSEGAEIHLDIYEGKLAGKVVAEVEFSKLGDETDEQVVTRAKAFEPPKWFHYKNGKPNEKTGVKQYSNRRLAFFGWPKGKAA